MIATISKYATNVAKTRDFPGKWRAKKDTGRFNTNAKKNDTAIIIIAPRVNQITPSAAKKPKITSQNRINVSVEIDKLSIELVKETPRPSVVLSQEVNNKAAKEKIASKLVFI